LEAGPSVRIHKTHAIRSHTQDEGFMVDLLAT
jgi:hypothetical protein